MRLKEQATTELAPETVVIEGHVYDAQTGEYMHPAEKDGFRIDDQATAEWFGEKIAEMDADIKALEMRKAALTANIDRQIADVQRHRDGMMFRYGAQLEAFAKANLPKGKRTWTCPFVSVAFRTVKASFRVRDESQALEWAKANCSEAVKVKESFLTSNVSDAMKILAPDVFDAVPERETVSIETGVGAQ